MRRICFLGCWIFPVCLFALVASDAFTADVPAVKPSTYAPAKDLIAQVEFFLDRIETDLEDPDEYLEEQQKRVGMDANTVAALAAVLGVHDEEHPLKAGAAALVQHAKGMAKNVKDYGTTKAEFVKAIQALEATSGGGKVGLAGSGDLAQLMRQVPIVNNSLRSGVMGTRFERLKEKSAASAATLAAIAEVSAYDDSYCVEDDDLEKWQKICYEMRDASAAVAKATRAGDQETAKKQLDRLVQTCDDCHHAFRD